MYKICVVGDRDSVIGFMSIGFSVYEAENAESAGEIINSLARDDEVAIIFVVEAFAEALEDLIAKFKDRPLPAIVPIPGKDGSTGYGMNAIKRAGERAIGADILFKN